MKKQGMMTVDVDGEYDDVYFQPTLKGTVGCLGIILGCLAIDAAVIFGIVKLVGYIASRT